MFGQPPVATNWFPINLGIQVKLRFYMWVQSQGFILFKAKIGSITCSVLNKLGY